MRETKKVNLLACAVILTLSGCFGIDEGSPPYPDFERPESSDIAGSWCEPGGDGRLLLISDQNFEAAKLHASYSDYPDAQNFWEEVRRDGSGRWKLFDIEKYDHVAVRLNYSDGSWAEFWSGRSSDGFVLWNKIDSNGKYSALVPCS